MTNGTANPLLTNTQSTIAAGFLSVLSTIGFPVPVAGASDPGSGNQSDSPAAASQQDLPAAPPQPATTEQQKGTQLPSPLSLLAANNLTILPANAFQVISSTRTAASPATPTTARNQKDDAAVATAPKTVSVGDTVAVPVPLVPMDAIAVPANLPAKTTAPAVPALSEVASISGIGTSAAVNTAQPGVPPQSLTSTQSAAPAATQDAPLQSAPEIPAPGTPMQQGTRATGVAAPVPAAQTVSKAVGQPATTPDTSTSTVATVDTTIHGTQTTGAPAQPAEAHQQGTAKTPSASVPSASAQDSRRPAPASASGSASGVTSPAPRSIATAKAEPQAPVLANPAPASFAQQANSNGAAAGDATASATPATSSSPARNSAQHEVPFVIPQAIAEVLKQVIPAATNAEPVKPAASFAQTPAVPAVAASAQPPASASAQSSPVRTVPAAGPSFQAVAGLPGLNLGTTATGSSDLTIGGNQGKSTDSGTGKDNSSGSNGAKNASGSSATTGTTADSTPNNASAHMQPDASQAAVLTARGSDAAPLQAVPVHISGQQQVPAGVPAGIDRPHPATTGTLVPSTSDGVEASGASGVNTAKLIQTLSETQMHVGMRSAEFGDISIRTAVSQQQMVAQITVDHGDLGHVLSQHISAAQSKLGDDLGIRAAIQVTQSGTSFSQHQGGSSQQEQRSFVRPLEGLGGVSLAETETVVPRPAELADDADRLDIRA
jgi:hypothetical protein